MNAPSIQPCYLSTHGGAVIGGMYTGRWSVIVGAMPICADKGNAREAMAAALQMNVTPTALWDGNRGKFIPVDVTNHDDEPTADYLNGINDYLTITARDGA